MVSLVEVMFKINHFKIFASFLFFIFSILWINIYQVTWSLTLITFIVSIISSLIITFIIGLFMKVKVNE